MPDTSKVFPTYCVDTDIYGTCGSVSYVLSSECIEGTVLMQMKDYCTDTKACRHALLLAYFGERFAAGRCDSCCDNCLARQQGATLLDDGIWLVSNPLVTSAASGCL